MYIYTYLYEKLTPQDTPKPPPQQNKLLADTSDRHHQLTWFVKDPPDSAEGQHSSVFLEHGQTSTWDAWKNPDLDRMMKSRHFWIEPVFLELKKMTSFQREPFLAKDPLYPLPPKHQPKSWWIFVHPKSNFFHSRSVSAYLQCWMFSPSLQPHPFGPRFSAWPKKLTWLKAERLSLWLMR